MGKGGKGGGERVKGGVRGMRKQGKKGVREMRKRRELSKVVCVRLRARGCVRG